LEITGGVGRGEGWKVNEGMSKLGAILQKIHVDKSSLELFGVGYYSFSLRMALMMDNIGIGTIQQLFDSVKIKK
jgi:hypothetical protein